MVEEKKIGIVGRITGFLIAFRKKLIFWTGILLLLNFFIVPPVLGYLCKGIAEKKASSYLGSEVHIDWLFIKIFPFQSATAFDVSVGGEEKKVFQNDLLKIGRVEADLNLIKSYLLDKISIGTVSCENLKMNVGSEDNEVSNIQSILDQYRAKKKLSFHTVILKDININLYLPIHRRYIIDGMKKMEIDYILQEGGIRKKEVKWWIERQKEIARKKAESPIIVLNIDNLFIENFRLPPVGKYLKESEEEIITVQGLRIRSPLKSVEGEAFRYPYPQNEGLKLNFLKLSMFLPAHEKDPIKFKNVHSQGVRHVELLLSGEIPSTSKRMLMSLEFSNLLSPILNQTQLMGGILVEDFKMEGVQVEFRGPNGLGEPGTQQLIFEELQGSYLPLLGSRVPSGNAGEILAKGLINTQYFAAPEMTEEDLKMEEIYKKQIEDERKHYKKERAKAIELAREKANNLSPENIDKAVGDGGSDNEKAEVKGEKLLEEGFKSTVKLRTIQKSAEVKRKPVGDFYFEVKDIKGTWPNISCKEIHWEINGLMIEPYSVWAWSQTDVSIVNGSLNIGMKIDGKSKLVIPGSIKNGKLFISGGVQVPKENPFETLVDKYSWHKSRNLGWDSKNILGNVSPENLRAFKFDWESNVSYVLSAEYQAELMNRKLSVEIKEAFARLYSGPPRLFEIGGTIMKPEFYLPDYFVDITDEIFPKTSSIQFKYIPVDFPEFKFETRAKAAKKKREGNELDKSNLSTTAESNAN